MKRQRGYFTLIGMLVVIAIIAIAAAYLYGGSGTSDRADKLGKSTLGRAVLKARDDECRTNLGQLREFLMMQHADEEKVTSLSQLNVPPKLLKCPVGGENYVLDVDTQTVSCIHPGHEKY